MPRLAGAEIYHRTQRCGGAGIRRRLLLKLWSGLPWPATDRAGHWREGCPMPSRSRQITISRSNRLPRGPTTIEAAWKWSKCAMKRRRRVPCDHPAPLGLIEQYEEVLRLRQEIHLAETDQHAARLPCDSQRTDASIRERPASVSRAQSGSDPHSEQVE